MHGMRRGSEEYVAMHRAWGLEYPQPIPLHFPFLTIRTSVTTNSQQRS